MMRFSLVSRIPTLLLALLLAAAPLSSARAQSATTFTYQGFLEDGGEALTGSVDLHFRLFDSEISGAPIGSAVTKEDVEIEDGIFSVDLDFGDVFGDAAVFLQIGVRDAASTGDFTTLTPRDALRPTPLAQVAQTALSLPGVTLDEGTMAVDGLIESTSGGFKLPDGTVLESTDDLGGEANAWNLNGNAGTDPSSDHLGTADDAALELRVWGSRALRLEPVLDASNTIQPNVIGGGVSNTVPSGIHSVTIGGGSINAGHGNFSTIGGGSTNTASGDSSTVAGGFRNTAEGLSSTIGGGANNTAPGENATVGGGEQNTASGTSASIGGGEQNVATGSFFATVGGGQDNAASDSYATVSGGGGNTAGDSYATVGGGLRNKVSGNRGTVPGGYENEVRSAYGFAAGYRARVQPNHGGSFVWGDASTSISNFGDGTEDSLVTSAPNQFLIRAVGGVGIGTNDPTSQLHVQRQVSGGAAPANHVAFFENTATSSGDVLALRTNTSTPSSSENYITFKRDGSDVGAIEGNGSGGVDLKSGGGDFAEMLPRLRPAETIEAGDLVGVVGGKITRRTKAAADLMVVSDQAVVVGNMPAETEAARHEQVAFVGQVPVKVRGTAKVGDYVVASGRHDGTGVAVSPEGWAPSEHGAIAGRVWEAKPSAGVDRINVLVGVDKFGAVTRRLARQQETIDVLETRLRRLEQSIQSSAASGSMP